MRADMVALPSRLLDLRAARVWYTDGSLSVKDRGCADGRRFAGAKLSSPSMADGSSWGGATLSNDGELLESRTLTNGFVACVLLYVLPLPRRTTGFSRSFRKASSPVLSSLPVLIFLLGAGRITLLALLSALGDRPNVDGDTLPLRPRKPKRP